MKDILKYASFKDILKSISEYSLTKIHLQKTVRYYCQKYTSRQMVLEY